MSYRAALRAAALAACTFAAPLAAQTGGSMSHDSAMDHGSMEKDAMDHGSMGKDAMDHDGMAKDAMGKDDNMMFMGAPGQKAAGDYAVSDAAGKHQLTLTPSFAVASAPDLYLVLANGDTPDNNALWIGKLKQTSGAQSYDLPKGKDVNNFSKLLVWSKKEKRAVASADWHGSGAGTMDHM